MWRNRERCMYSSDELFLCSLECYIGIYFQNCEATREIDINIAVEWALKQFSTRVHILFYFLHDITNPWMTIKMTIFAHCPRVSLAQFSFCWWFLNRFLMIPQWPDSCDAVTWIVMYNSLDIDFIPDDIHGRSCKNGISLQAVTKYHLKIACYF